MLTIREAIKRIVQDENEIYSVYATVDAVDEDARTIEATPLNGGAKLFDVRLQASVDNSEGVVIIPVVDSTVLITFTTKDTGFVSISEKVEKILIDTDEVTFNGGDNGGLINISDLVDKINTIEDAVNGLISSFNQHTHVTTATISASAVPGVISPTTSQNTGTITNTTTVASIEDDKIKH